jgi:molybdopterin molybdotransferase
VSQETGAREHVRIGLRAEDGALEAVKFPREGAGLLSWFMDCDSAVELGGAPDARRTGTDR